MDLPKPEIDRELAMKLWIEEHSEYAKEQLILNNVGMVGIVLKSLNLDTQDDDLFATGIAGIVKAVNAFDYIKGFAFSAYATQAVRNEILTSIGKKRIIPAFSLDEPFILPNGEEISRAEMIADDKCLEEEIIEDVQLRKALDFLNERERKIIFLSVIGKSQREIAKVFKISRTSVSMILRKAFGKIREKI